jgi:voltage-dependent potassium channel beta subunit
MEYRNLGRSGLKVSALSYGSWVTFGSQVDVDAAAEMMKIAYEAGVNFFDNAEAYAGGESEIIMGKALKKLGWKRSDLVLSTKIFWGGKGPNDSGLSRKHILEGTKAALDRLQLDYVDLVFCHRPDYETPIEETVRAMSYLVDRGYALYWGTSEWSAREITKAIELAERLRLVPPSMEQPQYNLLDRSRFEVEYKPLFEEYGIGSTTWSPLSSGVLTGKYGEGIKEGRLLLPGYEWLKERYESEEGKKRIETVERLRPIAEELGINLAQMSLAWVTKNPNVSTVITGASKPEQVEQNMKALEVAKLLTPEIMEKIDEVAGTKPEQPRNWR